MKKTRKRPSWTSAACQLSQVCVLHCMHCKRLLLTNTNKQTCSLDAQISVWGGRGELGSRAGEGGHSTAVVWGVSNWILLPLGSANQIWTQQHVGFGHCPHPLTQAELTPVPAPHLCSQLCTLPLNKAYEFVESSVAWLAIVFKASMQMMPCK